MKAALPTVSIVIVTHNSIACVTQLLDSLDDKALGCEIVVVDNDSRDGTPDAIERRYPSVRLHRLAENAGFGRANNIGVSMAKNEYILMLNPDTTVREVDSVQLHRLLAEERLGIVGVALAPPGQRMSLNVWPTLPSAWEWFNTSWRTLVPRGIAPRRPSGRSRRDVWVGGSAVLVRRSEFDVVGGFPEDVFLYYEDQILSHRYRACGFPVHGTYAVSVTHEQGTGSSDNTWNASLRRVSAVLGWLTLLVEAQGADYARPWCRRSRAAFSGAATLAAMGAQVMFRSERWARKQVQCSADYSLLEQCIAEGALVVSGQRFYTGALSLFVDH